MQDPTEPTPTPQIEPPRDPPPKPEHDPPKPPGGPAVPNPSEPPVQDPLPTPEHDPTRRACKTDRPSVFLERFCCPGVLFAQRGDCVHALNYPDRYSHSHLARGPPDLALQQRLGLWAGWSSGSHPDHRPHSSL